MIAFTLPLRLVSLANSREHWSARSRRAREHRWAAYRAGSEARAGGVVTLPCTVTITRIAPRALDDDNAVTSCKAVRDGVADALGLDDRDKRITWRVEQAKGAPKTYAVHVVIECHGDEEAPPPKAPPTTKRRTRRTSKPRRGVVPVAALPVGLQTMAREKIRRQRV